MGNFFEKSAMDGGLIVAVREGRLE